MEKWEAVREGLQGIMLSRYAYGIPRSHPSKKLTYAGFRIGTFRIPMRLVAAMCDATRPQRRPNTVVAHHQLSGFRGTRHERQL